MVITVCQWSAGARCFTCARRCCVDVVCVRVFRRAHLIVQEVYSGQPTNKFVHAFALHANPRAWSLLFLFASLALLCMIAASCRNIFSWLSLAFAPYYFVSPG